MGNSGSTSRAHRRYPPATLNTCPRLASCCNSCAAACDHREPGRPSELPRGTHAHEHCRTLAARTESIPRRHSTYTAHTTPWHNTRAVCVSCTCYSHAQPPEHPPGLGVPAAWPTSSPAPAAAPASSRTRGNDSARLAYGTFTDPASLQMSNCTGRRTSRSTWLLVPRRQRTWRSHESPHAGRGGGSGRQPITRGAPQQGDVRYATVGNSLVLGRRHRRNPRLNVGFVRGIEAGVRHDASTASVARAKV